LSTFNQVNKDNIFIASWSGGKDSCLACYKAEQKGLKIKFLLNMISRKYQRCCFHGLQKEIIHLQSDLIGIPLFQKEVSDKMEKYEDEFKEAVNFLKTKGANGMIFGDIYLTEHKSWLERVCSDLKIEMKEPLWEMSPEMVLKEFINAGFKAIVVSAKADLFDKDIIGRQVDKDFLKMLKKRDICPCGENGEYHTLVIDGPIFKKGGIKITRNQVVFKNDFWPHWFLDIQGFKITPK